MSGRERCSVDNGRQPRFLCSQQLDLFIQFPTTTMRLVLSIRAMTHINSPNGLFKMIYSFLSSLFLRLHLLRRGLQSLLILLHPVFPFDGGIGVFGFLRSDDRLQFGQLVLKRVDPFVARRGFDLQRPEFGGRLDSVRSLVCRQIGSEFTLSGLSMR